MMPTTIDVLEFVALADQSKGLPFSRQTHGLGSAYDIITPIDPVSGYGQWKHVKNKQGWPWDLKLYDQNFVYDWVTEKDWASGPRAYKKFIQNHVSGRGLADGMVQYPRFVSTTDASFDLDVPARLTNYATFVNCLQVGEPQSLGPVHQRLRGPFLIDHGKSVGPQLTLIHQYYWSNNGVATLEENHLALNYGWVSWKLQVLDPVTGLYKLVQETISNQVQKLLSPPTIDFPCF